MFYLFIPFRSIDIIPNNTGESGEITTAHLLLGIWSEKESAGHKILASLGFNDENAKEVAKSVSYKVLVFSFSSFLSLAALILILALCRWTRTML